MLRIILMIPFHFQIRYSSYRKLIKEGEYGTVEHANLSVQKVPYSTSLIFIGGGGGGGEKCLIYPPLKSKPSHYYVIGILCRIYNIILVKCLPVNSLLKNFMFRHMLY